MASGRSDGLEAARAETDCASRSLLLPTVANLDETARRLGAAIGQLTAFRSSRLEASWRKHALHESRRLQRSVHDARILLDQAFAFHADWARRRAALCGGYNVEGNPATAEHQARLLARG